MENPFCSWTAVRKCSTSTPLESRKRSEQQRRERSRARALEEASAVTKRGKYASGNGHVWKALASRDPNRQRILLVHALAA